MGPKFCADAIEAANAKIDEAAAQVDTAEVPLRMMMMMMMMMISFFFIRFIRESFMYFFCSDQRLDI